jgi:hypothetical protein
LGQVSLTERVNWSDDDSIENHTDDCNNATKARTPAFACGAGVVGIADSPVPARR